jgi:glucan phosphoethanolaminetransferase (alkaline phosphatase superfamily)
MTMASELTFFTRSWLNVIVVLICIMRRRSAEWILEALGVVASMVAVLLIAIGFLIYWLINKWGG